MDPDRAIDRFEQLFEAVQDLVPIQVG
jgi:hypothetical protein